MAAGAGVAAGVAGWRVAGVVSSVTEGASSPPTVSRESAVIDDTQISSWLDVRLEDSGGTKQSDHVENNPGRNAAVTKHDPAHEKQALAAECG